MTAKNIDGVTLPEFYTAQDEIESLRAALTAAQEQNAKLREALRDCVKLIDEDLNERGDDHSVGICMCDWVKASRVAHELLGD